LPAPFKAPVGYSHRANHRRQAGTVLSNVGMEPSEQLVSDQQREQAVESLRGDLLDGRLTLEEFSERVEIAYGARVAAELAGARVGLPVRAGGAPVPRAAAGARRSPTRFTGGLFSYVSQRGRLRLRRWTVLASVFSDVDLDLREAEADGAVSTVTVLALFGNADVYVPEGIEVEVGGVSVLGHRRDWGRDLARPDAPLIRVRALSLFGTVDVWRVPAELEGDFGEITRALETRQKQVPK
jgi:Domain of unknown function (DUF1707)